MKIKLVGAAGLVFSLMRCALLMLVAGLCFSIAGHARDAQQHASDFAAVDRVVADQINQGVIAGGVVRILHRGRLVKTAAHGFQDREAGVPMRESSVFRIASQTKAIVSAAVLLLQERGLVLLDDPVDIYLPEFIGSQVAEPRAENQALQAAKPLEQNAADQASFVVVPAKRRITIRDLLTHTSGIGYGFGPAQSLWRDAGVQGWYVADRDEPIRETVRRIAALPFDAHPGDAFVYGYSTDVLGALIEVVSGQPLDEFLAAEVFVPLSMVDTHFYLPVQKSERLARVYQHDENGELVPAPDTSDMSGQGEYVSGPRRSLSGGAGLLSTVEDYGRFLESLRVSLTPPKKRPRGGVPPLLSRKSVELMTVNHIGEKRIQPGVGFGLGLAVTLDLGARGTLGSVGEVGWGGAYHTSYWIDPAEQLVVVYMTQLLAAPTAKDDRLLRAAIYSSLY